MDRLNVCLSVYLPIPVRKLENNNILSAKDIESKGKQSIRAPVIIWNYRVSKNILYPKIQNFNNFYYNKDNRIWYFDLFEW